MRILLVDKDNRLLWSDEGDGLIRANAAVDFAADMDWTVIKLLHDYDTVWDMKVKIDKDWNLDYYED